VTALERYWAAIKQIATQARDMRERFNRIVMEVFSKLPIVELHPT
jgi:hypothetical protein